MKKLSQAIVLAGAMTAGLAAVNTAQAADVEISASAGVSNMYLWRGTDLGQGSAMVDGSLDVAMGGLYGGVWIGSGDSGAGQEYDLYVGYAGEAGDFSYDISAVTYTYPGESLEDGDREGNTFELSEYTIGLGYQFVSFSYTGPLAGDGNDDYSYITLGAGYDAYSLTIGFADDEGSEADYTHVDVGYAFNDNLSFTLSKIVDMDEDDSYDDDLKVAFYYSLPIEM
ncbi:MAG: TorF family putative porin [Pseudomonadota bacterium]|nr:TorF family putative porin [Pseudomonadota bacterium]